MTLDRAWTDEAAVVAYLEELLDARVRHLTVRRVDLVNETTIVDVRYRLNAPGRSAARVAR
jgi:tRNA (Thr-GGU) A37 N-methylase